MQKRENRQTLLSQAMRLKESDARADIQDLSRVKDDLDTRRQQLFLRCLVITAAILALLAAAVAAILI